MDGIAQTVSTLVEKALDLNATEMAIQIASTLLLFVVIKIFFWEKITAFIESRQKFMEDEFSDAVSANEEAQVLKEKADDELNEIRLSAKSIVEEAKLRGESERVEIVEKAKSEANMIFENSQKELKSEIEKARSSINDEIVSVAVLMAEKVINKEIDESKQKELLESITKEVMN